MNKYTYFLTLISCLTLNSYSVSKKAIKPIAENYIAEKDQKKFDYYYHQAIQQKEAGSYDQAMETFQMCLTIDSLDAGLNSELGMMYASIGLNNEAVKFTEKAVKFDATNWWYNTRLISFYTELKQLNKAIILSENLQQLYPNNEDVYTILTPLYKELKIYDKAIWAYDRLEKIAGIDPSISIEKFLIYEKLKKQKKADKEIERLITKFPTVSRYKVILGEIYMERNMPEKALEVYQKVLESDPENPYIYVSMSDYYNSKNEPEKAMDLIIKALKNEQLEVEQKIDILGQYVQKLIQDSTKLDETEKLFKLLVDRYPLEEQVHGYYSVFLQFRKHTEEAISELESMLNINPKNERTWSRLIQLCMSENKYDKLLIVTSNAIENLPDNPLWYFYKALTQFQLGDYKAALKSNQQALPLIKEDQEAFRSDIYAQIADVYFKLNEKDKAFEAYEQALKINSNNYFVMNNYAYYLSLENKNLKKAERLSAQTVEKEPTNSTYLDTYAWIFYQQQNYILAKFYIERAFENLDPKQDPAIIQEHYGDILWMAGNKEKAQEMWEKSLKSGNETEELKSKIINKGFK